MTRIESLMHSESAPEWQHVPERYRHKLVRYVLHGEVPDDLIVALLSGHLVRTLDIARDEKLSLSALRGLAHFISAHTPARCNGSAQRVDQWIADGGMTGIGAAENSSTTRGSNK